MMRGYLKYYDSTSKELRLPAFKKGSLLHSVIEHFWEKLGTEEEVAKTKGKKGGKKYSNAEEFAKHVRGKWFQLVIGSEKSNKPIDWEFENQKFVIGNSMTGICVPLFDELVKEGRPLYSEVPFEFVLGNRKFIGKIDEIRIREEKLILRDYKSGSPWIGDMKLNHDPQMTFYNVGICSKAYVDENFAKSIGLLEERASFMGHPIFISDKIHPEFFMVEAPYRRKKAIEEGNKNLPEIIHKTSRRDEHFYELIKMIDGAEKNMRNGIVYPERGRKCDYCSMKKPCEDKLGSSIIGESAEYMLTKNEQMLFRFAAPHFILPANIEGPKQKRFNFNKKTKKTVETLI